MTLIDYMCQEKKGGKGFDSINDSFDSSIQRLKNCIEKRGERLITTTRNNSYDTKTNRTTITIKQKWEAVWTIQATNE